MEEKGPGIMNARTFFSVRYYITPLFFLPGG